MITNTKGSYAEVGQMVIRVRDGNRDAMAYLYTRYWGCVESIVNRRLGYGSTDIEDVCQDIFLQAFSKIDQLREPTLFGAWISRIAHRMAINFTLRDPRKSGQLVTNDKECILGESREGTPLSNALREEQRKQVTDALPTLKPLDQETLIAFYIHGMSLLEMTDHFEAPVGTIKRRLHEARKRLAKELTI